MNDIRAVVFDWGGVLTVPPLAGLEMYGTELGLPEGALPKYVRGDEEFSKVERGELAVRDFLKSVCVRVQEAYGASVDIKRLASAMTASRDLDPDMVALVRSLSGSYVLGVLSNNIKENQSWLDSTLPADCFSLVLNSADLGLRKPDPKIYAEVVRRLGIDAQHIVYVDDFEENLPPAADMGFRTVHFTGYDSCVGELGALGVDVA